MPATPTMPPGRSRDLPNGPGWPIWPVHYTGPERVANTKGAEERYATSAPEMQAVDVYVRLAYAWAGTTCTRVWTFFLRVYFSYFTVPSTVANRV